MYVRGYLQGSENGRVVTIDPRIRFYDLVPFTVIVPFSHPFYRLDVCLPL